MAGDQICPRAQTTEVLTVGALGTFAVVMITSLTWLVVAFKRHDYNVLAFLHRLVYISCIFIVFLLGTHSTSYLEAELPNSASTVNIVLYIASGLFLVAGAFWIWKAPKDKSKSSDVSITSDAAVNWCAWAALIYLALTSLATGVVESSPPQKWNPYPAAWPIYLAAASSLVLPLVVVTLAIRGLARTAPARTAPTEAGDTAPDAQRVYISGPSKLNGVQQQSAATAPTRTDPRRPGKASDLCQRPPTTVMRLVHTEEVTGSIPVSPTSLNTT